MRASTVVPFLASALLAVAAFVAWAEEKPAGPAASPPEPEVKEENRLVMRSFGGRDELMQSAQAMKMRQKLQDPQAREALRAEYRAGIKTRHPDLTEVLALGVELEEQLFDLLTDQRMEHLDDFYAAGGAADDLRGEIDRMHAKQARDAEQLAGLLGAEKHEQYQEYQKTVRARMEVALLNRQLPPEDRLGGERKERFTRFLHQSFEDEMERRRLSMTSRFSAFQFPQLSGSPEDQRKQLAQHNFEMTLRANEEHLQEMEIDIQTRRAGAAQILTPRQLGGFMRMEQKKLEAQLKWVNEMRERGPDPNNTGAVATFIATPDAGPGD